MIGIEKAAELGDDAFEFARVGVGKIALVGRRLDLVDGQRGEDQPMFAERLAVSRQHFAAVPVDGVLQLGDAGRRRG